MLRVCKVARISQNFAISYKEQQVFFSRENLDIYNNYLPAYSFILNRHVAKRESWWNLLIVIL